MGLSYKLRTAILVNAALPAAWLVLRLVRALEPTRKGLMGSTVGRDASLSDTLRDARWHLRRLEQEAVR